MNFVLDSRSCAGSWRKDESPEIADRIDRDSGTARKLESIEGENQRADQSDRYPTLMLPSLISRVKVWVTLGSN
jgi:hypothetical protein